MKASELVAMIQRMIQEHGDVNVFFQNIEAVTADCFGVVEPVTDCPDELNMLDGKYLLVESP
jgi:hypothetical protein